jgi:Tol biopolymer transport system component
MEWAPDSRSVAVRGRDNKGRDAIFRIDTQTGAVSPLVLKAQGVFRPMWSPDGKILYYRRADRGGGAIISLDIASGAEREILQAKNLAQPRLSPDGRQFILIGGEGRGSLMVVPVDGGTPREILSLPKNESFRQLEWTSDGHSVIASKVGPGGFEAGLALWRIPVSGGSPQRMELNNASMAGEYSVHPDGRRIAFTSGQLKHEIWVIENFLPLLKASR